MLSTIDSRQTKGHIQTESEGLEKDISHKWRPKESRSKDLFLYLFSQSLSFDWGIQPIYI